MSIALAVVLGTLLHGVGCGACWALYRLQEMSSYAFVICNTWPVTIPAILSMRATRAVLASREKARRIEEERAAFVEREYREILSEDSVERGRNQ